MDRAIERQRIVFQLLKPPFSASSLGNLDSSIFSLEEFNSYNSKCQKHLDIYKECRKKEGAHLEPNGESIFVLFNS